MKHKQLTAIIIALFMGFLLAQGALAEEETAGPAIAGQDAQIEMNDIVVSIEADRSAVVDDLVSSFATDDGTADQLRATLDGLSTHELVDIAQNAASLDDVNSILSEDPDRLGDLTRDYAYTPVPPCRILDTRIAGGAFGPGARREFFVYGSLGFQGGATCHSPNGEPRGVHLYIVSVPVSGQGNFAAFPANLAPSGSVLNYRAGVQNIGNAATIKTFFSIGPREVEFQNRFGVSHLVVDVLGYYHSTENLAGADFAASSNNTIALSPTDITVKAVNITAPAPGKVIVNVAGYWDFNSIFDDSGRCSIVAGSSTAVDFTHLIIGSDIGNSVDLMSFGGTRGFNVGSGTTTFRLNCDEFEGNVSVSDTTINATWVPRTY